MVKGTNQLRSQKRRSTVTPLLVAVSLVSAVILFTAPVGAIAPQANEQGHLHSHGPDGTALERNGRALELATVGPAPAWSADEYDGAVRTTDAPDLANPSVLPTIHAVYLYPSDAPSRFSTFAAMFQRDARAASDILETLYDRELRFDERLGSDGVTRYLDITVIRSKYTARQLAGSRQFKLVVDELARTGLTNSNKKYLVWLDAQSRYCGESNVYGDPQRSASNGNERRTTSVAYRPFDAADPNTGGFCGRRTVLHELTHALGAVQPTAPNSAGYHCDDNANDVMCLNASAITYSGGTLYDYGRDDYWDPAADPTSGSSQRLPWWTVNLSRFVCPASGCAQPNSAPGY